MYLNHQLGFEDAQEIEILMSKCISMTNLKITIESKSEVDPQEADDIELAVDMVIDGTDIQKSDIMQRDGQSISFESDDNVLVAFIKVLIKKVKEAMARVKGWWNKLTDRRNALELSVAKTTAEIDKKYVPYEKGQKINIDSPRKEWLSSNTELLTEPRLIQRVIARSNATLELYRGKISPAISQVLTTLENLMKEEGEGIVYYNKLTKLGLNNPNNRVAELVDINKLFSGIWRSVITMDGGKPLPAAGNIYDYGRGSLCFRQGAIFARYLKTDEKQGDAALIAALNEFYVGFKTFETEHVKTFDSIEQDRFTESECVDLLDSVRDMQGELHVFSNLMKEIEKRNDQFEKLIDNALKSELSADKDHQVAAANDRAKKRLISLTRHVLNSDGGTAVKLYDQMLSSAFTILAIVRLHVSNTNNS